MVIEYWRRGKPSQAIQDNQLEFTQGSELRSQLVAQHIVNVRPGGDNNLAEVMQPDPEWSKVVAKHQIRVSGEADGTFAEAGQEERSQLVNIHNVIVRPAEEGRNEANRVEESRSELLAKYNILVSPIMNRVFGEKEQGGRQSPEMPRVDETEKKTSAADIKPSIKYEHNEGSSGKTLRSFLLDNKIPPVLLNQKTAFRIPVEGNDIVQRVEKLNCDEEKLETRSYVNQKPIETVEPRRQRVIGEVAAENVTLLRPIPNQQDCERCPTVKPSRRKYCQAAFGEYNHPDSTTIW